MLLIKKTYSILPNAAKIGEFDKFGLKEEHSNNHVLQKITPNEK